MDAAAPLERFGAQLHLHEQSRQLRCLMTTLCDRDSSQSDWVFVADRVNRCVPRVHAPPRPA